MVCIYCSGCTEVTNSRHQKKHNNIWRRRLCQVCGATFTSREFPDLTASTIVVGEDPSTLTPFYREKLFVSILQACGHREQPIVDATALTQTIVAKIPFSSEGSVSRDALVRAASEVLARFDSAAATHYAAYHPLATS
ncbi:MAG: hypothetical protein ACREGD_01580 [Candidatus Saccharimonadales bacterium]